MPGKERNPDDKAARLIKAVGEILSEEGYQGLSLNKITIRAGVSKPMVYVYFGNLNGLLKAYIGQTDPWMAYFATMKLADHPSANDLKACFTNLLQDQFRVFLTDTEIKKLVHWQISEPHPLMHTTCMAREKEGAKLINLSAPYFRDSKVDLKSILALLVGGIYYNVLHESAIGGTVAGTSVSNKADVEAMIKTIGQVMEWAFEKA